MAAEPAVSSVSERRDVTAVALAPDGQGVAFGTGRAVWLRGPDERERRVLRGLEVRDLLFDDAGGLWVASDRGLERLAGPTARDLSPAPGAARDVRRLAPGPGGALLVATARGAYLGGETGWQRLDGAAPAGEVNAIAYQPPDRVWLVVDGDLHSLRLETGPNGPRVAASSQHGLPGRGQVVVDLLSGSPAGAPPLVLTRDRLFATTDDGGLRGLTPRLPPGTEATRLARAAGAVWIATDRGPFRVLDGAAAFEPVAVGQGSAAVAALVARGDELWVAGARGIVRLRATAGRAAAGAPSAAVPLAWVAALRGPEPRELQRAVLRALDLQSRSLRRRATRVRVRGWLPEVELRAGYGGARRRDLDLDETFSSGEARLFRDRDVSRSRDFDVVASLRWDLGDTVFHPEELDVSKETRELIELRDEILDEIHQLYFERRRVLVELALHVSAGAEGAPPAWSPALASDPETRRLALRIDELAAGLDAWTGGWWTARVPSLLSPRFPQEPTP